MLMTLDGVISGLIFEKSSIKNKTKHDDNFRIISVFCHQIVKILHQRKLAVCWRKYFHYLKYAENSCRNLKQKRVLCYHRCLFKQFRPNCPTNLVREKHWSAEIGGEDPELVVLSDVGMKLLTVCALDSVASIGAFVASPCFPPLGARAVQICPSKYTLCFQFELKFATTDFNLLAIPISLDMLCYLWFVSKLRLYFQLGMNAISFSNILIKNIPHFGKKNAS